MKHRQMFVFQRNEDWIDTSTIPVVLVHVLVPHVVVLSYKTKMVHSPLKHNVNSVVVRVELRGIV